MCSTSPEWVIGNLDIENGKRRSRQLGSRDRGGCHFTVMGLFGHDGKRYAIGNDLNELLPQGEREQVDSGGYRDILPAAHRVTHWAAINTPRQRHLPK